VANSEAPREGRFLEIVGTYNPLTEPATVTVKEDKIREWLAKGAQVTGTVRNLLKKKGISANGKKPE
jgi:small subunit ribosomal protein S16